MATKRTEKEREEIIRQCVRIERAGGDVLAYLRSENYVSPEATWHNFQRYDLKRTKIRSGRPSKVNPEDKKDQVNRKRAQEIIKAAEEGKRCRDVVDSWGIHNIRQQAQRYRFLREWAKEWAEELFAKLPEKLEPAGTEQVKKPKVKVEKVKSVPEIRKEEPKPTRATDIDGFEIRCIRKEAYGELYRDDKCNCIDWRTPAGEEVRMRLEDWALFAKDLPAALKVLGVKA